AFHAAAAPGRSARKTEPIGRVSPLGQSVPVRLRARVPLGGMGAAQAIWNDMTAAAIPIPAPIRTYVSGYVHRRRWLRFVRATGRAVLFTFAWATACCGIDRLVALPSDVRFVLLLVNAVAAVLIVAPVIASMLHQPDFRAAAREIERREPRFGQRLETVVSRWIGPP